MLQKHPEYDITVLDKLTYAGVSKSKKRKAVRYKKRIECIDRQVIEAVKDYLAE